MDDEDSLKSFSERLFLYTKVKSLDDIIYHLDSIECRSRFRKERISKKKNIKIKEYKW